MQILLCFFFFLLLLVYFLSNFSNIFNSDSLFLFLISSCKKKKIPFPLLCKPLCMCVCVRVLCVCWWDGQSLLPQVKGSKKLNHHHKPPPKPSPEVFVIRPYRVEDKELLYRTCLETGDSGRDATDQFTNYPDLLGDRYAKQAYLFRCCFVCLFFSFSFLFIILYFIYYFVFYFLLFVCFF